MPQYIDSYYLISKRDINAFYELISKYSNKIKVIGDEFLLPQFSDSYKFIYNSVEELIFYLDSNPNVDYIIYWANQADNSEFKQFTLQYTDDGKMIIGISIVGREPDSKRSIEIFKEVRNHLNSQQGCITVEEPPPNNSIEFAKFCNERFKPV